MPGLWERLRGGLTRTRQGLGDRIRGAFAGRQWSDDLWESLEEILYEADLGVETVQHLLDESRRLARQKKPRMADEVIAMLHQVMLADLVVDRIPGEPPASDGLTIWVLVGVNGTGKTTTAGKMAHMMRQQGHQVILGAADTFRAAATEQLTVWAERAGVAVISQASGADSAAVAYDTVTAAVARHADLAIIDTAGRLHNKSQLMQELTKVHRVIGRALPGAPHEVWLVLDATTGQNGLLQAETFLSAVAITGIILTKLDGTAKGGVALAIARRLGVPIRYIGVGETLEDLMPFDPEAYVSAILGESLASEEA
jgi:fused signal recognition particle receptor